MEERWKEMITVRITVKLLGAIRFGIDATDRWMKTQGKGRRNGRGRKTEHQRGLSKYSSDQSNMIELTFGG